MRRGIFGGSFDPPHVGHLMVASDACDVLQLDRVTFVPNARQPLKAGTEMTDPATRLEMLRAAVSGDPRFEVDACEVERGGTSYMVDTLGDIRRRHPDDALFLCVGADVVTSFAQWRAPARIMELAHLAVLQRGGDGESDAAMVASLAALAGATALPPVLVPTRRVDLSSTEVRARVRAGRPVTGFVPEAVARFIAERGLYHTALP